MITCRECKATFKYADWESYSYSELTWETRLVCPFCRTYVYAPWDQEAIGESSQKTVGHDPPEVEPPLLRPSLPEWLKEHLIRHPN